MGSLLSKVIRWPIYGAFVLVAVSVVLGVWIGPEMEDRRLVVATLTPVHGRMNEGVTGAWFINGERGTIEDVVAGGGGSLEYAALSPWQDGWRSRQVVGRWIESSGLGTERVRKCFGLARYRYPDGEPLDRLETDVLPGGVPCWTTPTSDTLVFPTAAGRLYRFAFSGSDDPRAIDGRDAEPTPVSWGAWTELVPEVYDLSRPYGTGCGGLYLASVECVSEVGPRTGRREIWWLRIDDAGREVLEAGRLTRSDTAAAVGTERYPILGRGPDGGSSVAYLVRLPGRSEWTLRVVPVAIEPGASPPLRMVGVARDLIDGCAGSPPAFGADGRAIHVVVAPSGGDPGPPALRSVDLVSVDEARRPIDAESRSNHGRY